LASFSVNCILQRCYGLWNRQFLIISPKTIWWLCSCKPVVSICWSMHRLVQHVFIYVYVKTSHSHTDTHTYTDTYTEKETHRDSTHSHTHTHTHTHIYLRLILNYQSATLQLIPELSYLTYFFLTQNLLISHFNRIHWFFSRLFRWKDLWCGDLWMDTQSYSAVVSILKTFRNKTGIL